MPISHSKVSAKSDGADASLIRPSDWNAPHTQNLIADRPLVDPTGLSWSWVDQGSATITTYGAALELHDPASATDAWKMRVKAVPAKPYSCIVHVKPLILPVNFPGISIGWLQTSNNFFAGLGQYAATADLRLNSFKSGTNYSITANYVEISNNFAFYPWMAISDDVTNRRVWVSANGHDWILFHSDATNDFITPDNVFFGVESRNATYDASLVVDSWEETASSTP